MLEALGGLAGELPVVLPMHPRTAARTKDFGLEELLQAEGLVTVEPLPYLDFLQLMATARLVLTDSGGIQEETAVLGVPCLTLRDNTERPVTLEHGNVLLGTDATKILPAVRELLAGERTSFGVPENWDGRAAARIAAILAERYASPVDAG